MKQTRYYSINATVQPIARPEQPVDVIVPVYKGLDDTRRCLTSVLAAHCTTSWRLVIINDASPEPEITTWLRRFAVTDQRITLLENEQNLGFVGTVNRGMSQSSDHDVVLLNSDAEVANDWLDRMQSAACGDQNVATVTPFSNNATICSYPDFCQDNDLPDGWDLADLDAVFARTNPGQVIDVPTGVGFCMYIRRAALQQIGLFNTEDFGKGYGEENDFCMNAAKAGWRNLHTLDTFVRHYGAVSFGDSQAPRLQAAMETMRRLHPHYDRDVQRFIREDPAWKARAAVDIARLQTDQCPVVLAVLHNRGGGTERHVNEIAAQLAPRVRFLTLKPQGDQRLCLQLLASQIHLRWRFDLPDDQSALVDVLQQFDVCHIHYHHLAGHDDFVRRLPATLGVSYDFTAHDYYTICPRISLTDTQGHYCGETGAGECRRCLCDSRAVDGSPTEGWREANKRFMQQARYVIAPSYDVLARLRNMAPGAHFKWVPHTDIGPSQHWPEPAPVKLEKERPLKVAVIGAMSAIKGFNVLEKTALAAHKNKAPIEFHLIGYGWRALVKRARTKLIVHGAYQENDLCQQLGQLQPDIVWFPAQCPETYSYTLSACLQNGWPVVAPDIGAFAERLAGRPWTWICPWRRGPEQWLAFFNDIRTRHFAIGEGPVPLQTSVSFDDQATTPDFNRESPDWYADDYLHSLPKQRVCNLSSQTLMAYLLPPEHTAVAGTKGRLLKLLLRLRNMRLLLPLARRVPIHWQTRLKSWLYG